MRIINKILNAWKFIGVVLLNSLILVIFLESACFILYKIVNSTDVIDERMKAPVYKDYPSELNYWKDHYRRKKVYKPWVIWGSGTLKGESINIDETNIRKTVPNPTENKKNKKIFFFGGSTMFGTGTIDTNTIPSLFSKKLWRNNIKNTYCTNFGTSGYVIYQEMLQLIEEIRVGNIPDTVIFYDGVNDIYSGYQNHIANVHENYFTIKNKFELGLLYNVKRTVLKSYFIKMFQSIRYRIAKIELKNKNYSKNKKTNIDTDKLAFQIADNYLKTRNLLISLSQKYNFKIYFFIQPMVIFKKGKLDEYEKEKLELLSPVFKELAYKTYDYIDKDKISNQYNIKSVFENTTQSVYIDAYHLGPAGNKIIADQIYKIVF